MQLGMIGLGRMGANMVRRLLRAGQQCVVFDRSPQAVEALVTEKAVGTRAACPFEPGLIYLVDKRKQQDSMEVFADQVGTLAKESEKP